MTMDRNEHFQAIGLRCFGVFLPSRWRAPTKFSYDCSYFRHFLWFEYLKALTWWPYISHLSTTNPIPTVTDAVHFNWIIRKWILSSHRQCTCFMRILIKMNSPRKRQAKRSKPDVYIHWRKFYCPTEINKYR